MYSNRLQSYPQSSIVKSSFPLAIIYNPSEDYSLTAGNVFSLRVTITNQGVRSALVNIYIDETSHPLWEWCDRPLQQIALSVGESSEVVFQFTIPLTTIPATYEYVLVIDAPKHYPQETPLSHRGSLNILSPVESVVSVKDPTFVLTPETTSDKPLPIHSGQTIDIQALVLNNTDRVDKFRLRCLDIPASWYQIIYPEGVEELGLVVETKSLALNPNTKGKILLRLTLPKNINASSYTASIQLYSSNNPDLFLLDIFYFKVIPIYKLNFQLNALIREVRTLPGIYELVIENLGNTKREIITQATTLREDNLCKFTINKPKIQINPEEIGETKIEIKPQKWWRRPFFGRGMPIDFEISFIDAYQLSLPRAKLKGQLIWEARPWWHLLLLILTGISIISTIIFLIWWFFFKPPTPPKIIDFASDSSNYQALNNDFIRLNWEIQNAKQIKNITLVGLTPTGQVISRQQRYQFNKGIPKELKPFCNFNKNLTCINVRTDASRPGDYIFKIEVQPKISRQQIVSQKTNLIIVKPLPQPKIIKLLAQLKPSDTQQNLLSKPPINDQIQTKTNDANSSDIPVIMLDFTINYWEQLESIQLLGRNAEQVISMKPQIYKFNNSIPDVLKSFCVSSLDKQQLACQNIPIKINSHGTYNFELKITSKDSNQQVIDTQISDNIEISPIPIPQIISFNSSQPTYQENEEIRLNWNIINPKNLGEIQLISRSPEGVVNVPLTSYNFIQGLPKQLASFCQLQLNNNLLCQNVPTNANNPGNYRFELTVIPQTNPTQKSSMSSDLVPIKSLPIPEIPSIEYPLNITSFTINNEPAPAKYIVTINPQQPAPELTISWQVESSPKARVELLPSPGEVPKLGTLSYPLTPKAGEETLTLKVQDETGKAITRSVIIDKIISQEKDSSTGSSATSSPNSQSTKIPKIGQEEIIIPSDLPPKF